MSHPVIATSHSLRDVRIRIELGLPFDIDGVLALLDVLEDVRQEYSEEDRESYAPEDLPGLYRELNYQLRAVQDERDEAEARALKEGSSVEEWRLRAEKAENLLAECLAKKKKKKKKLRAGVSRT